MHYFGVMTDIKYIYKTKEKNTFSSCHLVRWKVQGELSCP